MSIELDIAPPRTHRVEDEDVVFTRAPLVGALPAGWSLTERAAGLLQAYLVKHALNNYRVFFCKDLDLAGIDRCLDSIEPEALWEPAAASIVEGYAPEVLTHGTTAARFWPAGFLRLPQHEMVIARWYWVDEYTNLRELWLAAAPSTNRYVQLRDAVRKHRRDDGRGVWQVFRDGWNEPERLPRQNCAPDFLTLDPTLRERLQGDIVQFFSPQMAKLYVSLQVPYRRGVLLHGPPGNGKTSLIKLIAASIGDVSMLVLRPNARFNADAIQKVLQRWSQQAPAVLVIEDLDWMLKQVNVSAFLNALDGVEAPAARSDQVGLLLIATTNHPEQLDPAINNRPGRFDVVIEMPCPSTQLREEFFRRKLARPGDQLAFVDAVVELLRQTEGLSFAHLQEILRESGLAAIRAGRTHRVAADLLAAAATARAANEQASSGFPIKPDTPFGLAQRPK